MKRFNATFDNGNWLVFGRHTMLMLLLVPAVLLSLSLPTSAFAIAVWSFASTLVTFVAASVGLRVWDSIHAERDLRMALAVIEAEKNPVLMTNFAGGIIGLNPAARRDWWSKDMKVLPKNMSAIACEPEHEVTETLCSILTGEEGHVTIRIAHHEIGLVGCQMSDKILIWREISEVLDDAADPGEASLIYSHNGTVLQMNAAARDLFGNSLRQIHVGNGNAKIDLRSPFVWKINETPTKITPRILHEAPSRTKLGFVIGAPVVEEPTVASRVDDLPVAILLMSTKGRIKHANQAALALTERTDMIGASLSEVATTLGRPIDHWFNEAVSLGGRHAEVVRLMGARNDTFLKITLEVDRSQPDASIIAVLTDATELKNLEAQFVQSQKMQAIGQLAGGVAHDFNNLLTAITGHCDLLLLRYDKGDQDYADLIQINQNANRAAALVRQLLAFSRKQRLEAERLDLRSTLSDLTHLLNRLVGERIKLTLVHAAEPVFVRADKRQLEQVFMNLIVNARDAMPDGGRIQIKTRLQHFNTPQRTKSVTIPEGQYVVIDVSDTGNGIPLDLLDKVFEPFFTTKRNGDGTGLGLSTVYGIIKQTGGYILLSSQENAGTTFSVYLRRDTNKATQKLLPPDPAQAGPKRASRQRKVFLLVEDEAPVRAFAVRALQLQGHDVLEATTGEQGLQLYSEHSERIDLIITDVIMPGLDGPSWVAKAFQQRSNVPVVFMSGYPEDVFEKNETQFQNATFLSKPFSLSEFNQTVETALQATDYDNG